jgi:hypothetical protein
MARGINYPITPVSLNSFNCKVTLNITTRDPDAPLLGTYSIRGAGLAPVPNSNPHLNDFPYERSFQLQLYGPQRVSRPFFDLVPGSMDVCIIPHAPADFPIRVFPFEMLPGETRVIDFEL